LLPRDGQPARAKLHPCEAAPRASPWTGSHVQSCELRLSNYPQRFFSEKNYPHQFLVTPPLALGCACTMSSSIRRWLVPLQLVSSSLTLRGAHFPHGMHVELVDLFCSAPHPSPRLLSDVVCPALHNTSYLDEPQTSRTP
jgi:hypothetical protein